MVSLGADSLRRTGSAAVAPLMPYSAVIAFHSELAANFVAKRSSEAANESPLNVIVLSAGFAITRPPSE
ncbi:MAG: hypothetical protein HY075_04050 [Deltaproteobacteria bacterium]|nr:hypothetical protein [Deltaproteobacteria bacterium]